MKHSKIKKIFLSLVLLGLFILPNLIFAQEVIDPYGDKYGLTITAEEADLVATGGKTNSPQIIISRAVGYILAFIGIIMLINIIFAGYQWMSAGGNEETIKKAKDKIKNSIIGLIIIVASYLLTDLIFGTLGGIIGG